MKKLTFLLTILMVLIQHYPLKAQDSIQIVIISPRVGAFIEPGEQKYFKLFPNISDFVLAYIFKTTNDNYTAKIHLINNNILQEKTFTITEKALLSESERINNYEKINKENPGKLELVWINKNEIPNKINEQMKMIYGYILLPEKGKEYSKFFTSYPRFGFGTGLFYTTFTFNEIQSLVNSIDSYFRQMDVFLPAVSPNYQLSSILRLKGSAEFNDHFSAVLIIDYDSWINNISYNALSVIVIYKMNNLMENFIPLVGLGYTKNNFNIKIDYGSTTINDSGGQLESVSVDGGTQGLIVEAGVEIPLSASFRLGIIADYYFLSSYSYTESYSGFNSEIDPGNFDAGIFLNFLF